MLFFSQRARESGLVVLSIINKTKFPKRHVRWFFTRNVFISALCFPFGFDEACNIFCLLLLLNFLCILWKMQLQFFLDNFVYCEKCLCYLASLLCSAAVFFFRRTTNTQQKRWTTTKSLYVWVWMVVFFILACVRVWVRTATVFWWGWLIRLFFEGFYLFPLNLLIFLKESPSFLLVWSLLLIRLYLLINTWLYFYPC